MQSNQSGHCSCNLKKGNLNDLARYLTTKHAGQPELTKFAINSLVMMLELNFIITITNYTVKTHV